LFEIAKLQPGERVFVSAAAGAVGSMVCQIAKSIGCFVVGSAGSDEKCAWLKDVAGIDEVINYRTTDDLSLSERHFRMESTLFRECRRRAFCRSPRQHGGKRTDRRMRNDRGLQQCRRAGDEG
jgi:threonine dehydrogenase-like Zn-dependent dehydrogenase